jgi:hypothetical protein
MLSLFGLPFLIGSVFLLGHCAMTVAGKVELSQSEDRLKLFMGVGPLGWTRSYLWSDFNSVREGNHRSGFTWNRQAPVILLEGKRRAAFGSMWNEGRRYFVLSALRQMLRNANRANSATIMTPIFR